MAEQFSGWALVEQMGHKSIAGFVREELLAGVPLLRIDVPGQSDEPIATQYIHASTIYALTPMAEDLVRKVAARTRVEPAATWGVDRALPPAPDEVIDELLVNRGLAGVLELLSANYRDVPEPDCDRYVAILEHARSMVDGHRWPDGAEAAATTGD